MTSSSPSLAFCSNFSAIFSSSSMKNFYGFASGYQFSILIGQPIETFLGTSIFFSLVCHFAEILFWMISLWQEQYAFGTIELIIKLTYRGCFNRMVISSNVNTSHFWGHKILSVRNLKKSWNYLRKHFWHIWNFSNHFINDISKPEYSWTIHEPDHLGTINVRQDRTAIKLMLESAEDCPRPSISGPWFVQNFRVRSRFLKSLYILVPRSMTLKLQLLSIQCTGSLAVYHG